MEIRSVTGGDCSRGFIDALSCLAPVDLDQERIEEILGERTRQGWETFVAVDEARIIGTASVLIERKLIHGGSNVAHIEDVAVLADYRCRGIGMALVRHVIAYASSCGCYKAVLHCNESLGEFYHGAGFRKQGLSMRVDYPKSL